MAERRLFYTKLQPVALTASDFGLLVHPVQFNPVINRNRIHIWNIMNKSIRSKQGFTLVEIMIVVVIIALLAAMAIPAFQKVRQNSRKSAMVNDARQLASGAQQYFLEHSVTTVNVTYTSTSGLITGDLSSYVKQIGTGYTTTPSAISADVSFSIVHPLVGTDGVYFNSEGQVYQQ